MINKKRSRDKKTQDKDNVAMSMKGKGLAKIKQNGGTLFIE